MKLIDLNKLVIERLEDHFIADFSSNVEDLTDFLLENSRIQMDARINVTYLTIYNGSIVAYFTLSADSIRLRDIGEEGKRLLETKGIRYPSLPALKICRLAVRKEYTNNNIGTYLVEKIIRQAQDLSSKIGLRFITVDSYLGSLSFYTEKFQFKIFPKLKYQNKMKNYLSNPQGFEETETIPLYLDICEK